MYDSYQKLAQKTRLKIPVIYGIDAVHGHNNVKGATIFPQYWSRLYIDPKIVYKVSDITAREVTATGLNWNFAPCLTMPEDERWGRYHEGYSENPELVSELGVLLLRLSKQTWQKTFYCSLCKTFHWRWCNYLGYR